MKRRTEGEARQDSCDIGSFKAVRRRLVQTSSQVMCASCRRAVSAIRGCLFSDCGQSYFKQEHFIRAGCWMVAGTERWESHECNKPGQLQTDYRVYKKRIAGGTEEAVVQGVMVETWEYEDEDYVFEFGHEVSADVQRRETHHCIGGASRSACGLGRVSELTTRSTTPPLSPRTGPSIEQRGCKKVHRRERGLNTLVESSQLVLVKSVSSLEQNGTSVALTCSDGYDPSRQPRPSLQSSRVYCLLNKREVERLGSKQTGT